jgi:serine/threonine-protein kinase
MEPHTRIGDYEVLEELGRGGMGRVFRARNVISDRIEAMKVLLPDLVGRQDLAARFLREIKVLAALSHPHIAGLRTALTADNQLIMIMEFVEGKPLANRLTQGPLMASEAMNYIDQVLDALSYAHAQGVIHRDIKPANMMVTPQGVLKLTDFGIARSANDQTLTATGTTTGSLSYMSPEQVNGEPTDPRSDLYSVGVSLYEMVTGLKPFRADSDFGIMRAHIEMRPRPPAELAPGLPVGLNDVILKAIAKNPVDRYQSADEFRAALRKISTAAVAPAVAAPVSHTLDATIPSRGASNPEQTAGRVPPSMPPPPRRVHPGLYMALGGVLVIAALIGTGVYLRKAEAGTERTSTTGPAPAAAAPAATPSPAPTASPLPAASPAESPSASPTASPTPGTSASTPAEAPAVVPPPSTPERAAVAPPRTVPLRPAAASGPKASSARKESAQPDAINLDQLERDLDQMSGRVSATNSSLDRMQQEQARMGLGLRADMASRQQSMNLNFSKAQDALEKHDGARAKRYRDLALGDLEALEHFLGR